MKPATDISEFPAGAMALPPLVDRSAHAHRHDVDAEASTAQGGLWRQFYELTKPRMNMLVVATTFFGFYAATYRGLDWWRLLHTVLGTALTAAGASVLNQYIERGYDALMRRTQDRPLPSGRVSPTHALLMGVCFGVTGVLYLALKVNFLTAALGALTLASYVWVYTPMKRWSTLCTVVGAVPGAIPPLMGWTAVRHGLSAEALVLFGILFLWQMPHFLAIAVLYRDDYDAGGFKMLPCADPDLAATGRQIVVYLMSLLPVTLMPFGLRMAGTGYLVAAIVLGGVFLTYGVRAALGKTRDDARRLFFVSIIYLPLLLVSMMVDKF